MRQALCVVLAIALWAAGASLFPTMTAAATVMAPDPGMAMPADVPCPDMSDMAQDISCQATCALFVAVETMPGPLAEGRPSTDFADVAAHLVSTRVAPDPYPPRTTVI